MSIRLVWLLLVTPCNSHLLPYINSMYYLVNNHGITSKISSTPSLRYQLNFDNLVKIDKCPSFSWRWKWHAHFSTKYQKNIRSSSCCIIQSLTHTRDIVVNSNVFLRLKHDSESPTDQDRHEWTLFMTVHTCQRGVLCVLSVMYTVNITHVIH